MFRVPYMEFKFIPELQGLKVLALRFSVVAEVSEEKM